MKRSLDGSLFWGDFLHLKSCESTQDRIKATDNFWYLIQADRQTAGRGRKEHKWHSREGGLYYSLRFPAEQFNVPNSVLPMGAASIWLELLSSHYPQTSGQLSLKWPNDLLLDDRKLAGFLGEKSGDSLLLGVGLNVNNDFPEDDYKYPPISLSDYLKVSASTTSLLLEWYGLFQREVQNGKKSPHFQPEVIKTKMSTIGQDLKTEDGIGTAVDLCSDGSLRVKLNDEYRKFHTHDDFEVVKT